MNILIIGNSESVHTARFANEFVNRKHKVSVLSSREYFGDYAQYHKDIDHVRFLRWLTKIFQFIFGKKFRNFNPEISSKCHPMNFLILLRHLYLALFINSVVAKINSESIFALNLSIGGFMASRIKKRIPKVCTTLGTDVNIHKFPKPAYFINHPLLVRYTLKKLDTVITGDKEVFESLIKKRGFAKLADFIYFGHFGIETERFSPNLRDENTRRQLFGIESSAVLALCHRPPRPNLDFENIIKAIPKVAAGNNSFVFVVFTGGNNVRELKELVGNLNIDSHVIFIDMIPYEKLHIYVTQGDIFIDPANIKKVPRIKFSGVSGSLLEAMSCGLIPVISNRPSINWILPDEAKPFIFEDFETDLLGAIEKAIKEKDNKKIKDAMRKAVIEKANWNKNLDKIENLLSGGKNEI